MEESKHMMQIAKKAKEDKAKTNKAVRTMTKNFNSLLEETRNITTITSAKTLKMEPVTESFPKDLKNQEVSKMKSDKC